MHNNGNGSNGGKPERWWTFWKRERQVDLSSYRQLALQLHNSLPRGESGARVRSVLLVTANETEQCASCAVRLVTAMAEELQQPILLVDVTPNSEVSGILHAPASAGVTDFLMNPVQPLQELASRTNRDNVWFMSRGTGQGALLSASPENARDLLVRTLGHWDFVVVAGGPVLSNTVNLAMAPHIGRVLLLVSENHTYVHDIDAAQNVLESCQARNVSLVMAQTDASLL